MKPKPILALVAVAALAPLAWAGSQTARQNRSTPATGLSHARRAPKAKQAGKQNNLAIDSGTRISARLLTSVNAKKAKQGQRVVAKVTQNVKQHGRVVIRKNSRLIGHITSVQASGKGNTGSRVGVAFDHLVQGKSSTALNAVVTSILSVPSAPMPPSMEMPARPMTPPMSGGGAAGGGGGLLGGAVGSVGSTVGSTVGAAGTTVGSTAGATGRTAGSVGRMGSMAGNPILVSNSATAAGHGSAGLSNSLAGAQLGSSASASNQAAATSMFSRRKGNLDLESGTQLQFQVVGSAHARKPSVH